MDLIQPDMAVSEDPMKLAQNLFVRQRLQQADYVITDNAYSGKTPHDGFSTEEFSRRFTYLQKFTVNFLQMIVDAYVSRLVLQGFDFEGPTPSNAHNSANSVWQANNLATQANLAHRDALKYGESYLLVDPFTQVGRDSVNRITVESPLQLTAMWDPADPTTNAAALKTWPTADGFINANLYTSGHVFKYRARDGQADARQQGVNIYYPQPMNWEQYDEFTHDLGVCPVVSLRNRPTLTKGGVSELEALLPLQTALNNLARNMMVAAEYAAFPQKIILGAQLPDDNHARLELSMQRLMGTPPVSKDNHAPTFGDFTPADLQNYVTAMEELVREMASVSSIPGYRLVGQMANLSASAITALEAGFIDACNAKQVDLGAGWSQALALAVPFEAYAYEINPLWKDASALTGPLLAQSVAPLAGADVPTEVMWSMLGASPADIDHWRDLNEQEAKAKMAQAQANIAAGLGADGKGVAPLPLQGVPTENGVTVEATPAATGAGSAPGNTAGADPMSRGGIMPV